MNGMMVDRGCRASWPTGWN